MDTDIQQMIAKAETSENPAVRALAAAWKEWGTSERALSDVRQTLSDAQREADLRIIPLSVDAGKARGAADEQVRKARQIIADAEKTVADAQRTITRAEQPTQAEETSCPGDEGLG